MTESTLQIDPSSRRLTWDACYNAREVGGYPTADGGTLAWRRLVRTDNLSRLTPLGQAALVKYGVRTIIDLRDPSELAMEPHAFLTPSTLATAPAYYNLPLIRFDDQGWQAATQTLVSTPSYYCGTLDYFKPEVAAIMRAVVATDEGSVLIHCHAGKDRTGLVIALLLAAAGVAPDLIAQDYALSNHYLQPWYDGLLAQHADDPERQARMRADFKTQPQFMLDVLAHLDARYGGIRGYLLAVGLTELEIEQIRTRLRA